MLVNTACLIETFKRNLVVGTSQSRGAQMMRLSEAVRQEGAWKLTLLVPESSFKPHAIIEDQDVTVNDSGECSVLESTTCEFLILRIRKDDGGVGHSDWINEMLSKGASNP